MPDQAPSSSASTSSLPIHRDPQVRRLLAVGLLAALIRWFEILAFGLFTWQATQSAFWVASMTMLRVLPMGLFGVPFGALAARISRRRGLLVTQAVLFVCALALMLLSLAGALEVWHLAVASFINGTAWAGDNPMRRGLIGDIAGAGRMPQAMALDALFNSACRLGGPALGGILLASGGPAAVFLATAVLYLASFLTLRGLSKRPERHENPSSVFGGILVGGIRAVRESPRLAATLWVTLVFNIFGWPVLSMVPVIGQERLGLSAQAVGLLASMDGVGALLGVIVLTAMARTSWHGYLYVGGVCVYLAMLPVFALSVSPLLSGVALMAVGLGHSGFAVTQAALAYTSAPAERRLQAMGLLTMCIGVGPVGFLAIGWLANRFGAPTAAVSGAVSGLLCLLVTWPMWRACLREAPQR